MTGFAVPPFATGRGDRFRISAYDIAQRHSPFTCPMGSALRARVRAGSVAVDSGHRGRFDKASALNFALQRAARAVVTGIEPRQAAAGETDLTHSQHRFLAHALDALADLLPAIEAATGARYRIGEDILGRVDGHGLRGTVTAWSLHLETADGDVHEAVRLRTGPLRAPTDADLDWTASAAVALATDDATAPGARIRVSEFSLLDGALRTDFDGNRDTAIRRFAERGHPLWPALAGTVFRPGAACAGCPALRVCPAVPSHPGLLGAADPVATRKLSASDLAAYARCPTEFRALRADHLPDRFSPDADPSVADAARARGVGVHAWLAWAHGRDPARRCDPSELPDAADPSAQNAAAAAGLDRDGYAAALPYLRAHLPLCPVGRDDLTGWDPEHRWVCHDPDADAVVITTPDLTYRVDGGDTVVWRETKTSGSLPADLNGALLRYPDFALDVVVLAMRAEAAHGPYLAELEVLTPAGGEVFAVSTGDADAVRDARRLVSGIAGRFVTDTTFERNPGPRCAGCAAHGWCDPPADPRSTR